MKPRLLDLFCGAGGAAMGYYRAGFEVVGVDIKPQPHYPFEFHQADALNYPLEGFDAYHASPPCQSYSPCTNLEQRVNYPKLIIPMQRLLHGKLYVIENVKGARKELKSTLWLCGTMFGLPIHRHRYFELSFEQFDLRPPCGSESEIYYITGSKVKNGEYVREPNSQERKQYLGTPWMTINEMDECIPPAYTEYIGKYLMKELNEN
jgi:DNA (cytosine-5)-methyltransferase 1